MVTEGMNAAAKPSTPRRKVLALGSTSALALAITLLALGGLGVMVDICALVLATAVDASGDIEALPIFGLFGFASPFVAGGILALLHLYRWEDEVALRG